MVTRNWYNQFKAMLARAVIPGGMIVWDGSTDNAGYYVNSMSNQPDTLSFYVKNVVYSVTEGIVLGSGTTPATMDDHKLEAQITSGLSVSVVRAADANSNASFTLTITNLSDKDITIGEIGIVDTCYRGNNSNTISYALTERTVLDAPITIPGGGVGLVTYTISMTMPEN